MGQMWGAASCFSCNFRAIIGSTSSFPSLFLNGNSMGKLLSHCLPLHHQVTRGAGPGVPRDQTAATVWSLLPSSFLLSFYLFIISSPHIQVHKTSFSCTYHQWDGMSFSFYKDLWRMPSLGKNRCSLDPNSTSQENSFFSLKKSLVISEIHYPKN